MTQQTITCRMPSKLDWYPIYPDGVFDAEDMKPTGYMARTAFHTFYYVDYVSENSEKSIAKYGEDELGTFNTSKEARFACQADYKRRWIEGSVPDKLYCHKNSYVTYAMLGEAKLQTAAPLSDMADLVVYQGQDGQLWTRAKNEFFDGRFEKVDKLWPGDPYGLTKSLPLMESNTSKLSHYKNLLQIFNAFPPFCKPESIEECPRQDNTLYMLFSVRYEPMLAKPKGKNCWLMMPLGQETSADGYTHFAEIPPCEVQS